MSHHVPHSSDTHHRNLQWQPTVFPTAVSCTMMSFTAMSHIVFTPTATSLTTVPTPQWLTAAPHVAVSYTVTSHTAMSHTAVFCTVVTHAVVTCTAVPERPRPLPHSQDDLRAPDVLYWHFSLQGRSHTARSIWFWYVFLFFFFKEKFSFLNRQSKLYLQVHKEREIDPKELPETWRFGFWFSVISPALRGLQD